MAKEKKGKKRLLKAGLIILGLTVIGTLISGGIGFITIAKDIITLGAVVETGIVSGGITNSIITAIKNKKTMIFFSIIRSYLFFFISCPSLVVTIPFGSIIFTGIVSV